MSYLQDCIEMAALASEGCGADIASIAPKLEFRY
jgi:hypothetical protein